MYILKSITQPGQLHVGVTSNLTRRLIHHNDGHDSHTSRFGPWEVVYVECVDQRATALRRERKLKAWSRAQKEALICGEPVILKKLPSHRMS